MKYAKEVIDLLACYPGREFRAKEIINHVMAAMHLSSECRIKVRKGVDRVLGQMASSGAVHIIPATKRGEFSRYYFGKKCDIKHLENDPGLETMTRPKLRPQKQHDPLRAYESQKNGARQRGIEWQFTYETWWDVWKNDFPRRGPRKDDLCMARYGDEGPYSPENVYLTTNGRNSVDRNTSAKAANRKAQTIERRGRALFLGRGHGSDVLRRQDLLNSLRED